MIFRSFIKQAGIKVQQFSMFTLTQGRRESDHGRN